MAGRTPAVRRRDVRALLCPDRRPRRRRDGRRPGDEGRPPEAEHDPAADLDVVGMVSDILMWLGTANNGAQGAVVSAGCRDLGPDGDDGESDEESQDEPGQGTLDAIQDFIDETKRFR